MEEATESSISEDDITEFAKYFIDKNPTKYINTAVSPVPTSPVRIIEEEEEDDDEYDDDDFIPECSFDEDEIDIEVAEAAE